jgi:hypothetical protein
LLAVILCGRPPTGFLALAGRRARSDAAVALSIQRGALHMKPRDLRKSIRDLSE